MTADDLLEIARELANREPAKPRQSSLKRSTSTAYYALFHALAQECVEQILGESFRSDHDRKTVSSVYRVIDHAPAKRVFSRFATERSSSADLRFVALACVELQEARIKADYNPSPSFTRGEALQSVRRAEEAIRQLRSLPTTSSKTSSSR